MRKRGGETGFTGPALGALPLFTHELGAIASWMWRLPRRGRKGGAVALLLGAALGALGAAGLFAVIEGADRDVVSPALSWVSLAVFILGVVATGRGAFALAFPTPVAPRPGREAFLQQLSQAPKPVRACLRCRQVLEATTCGECASTQDCFDVESDADLRVVAAALID